jgi:hypothetical protein
VTIRARFVSLAVCVASLLLLASAAQAQNCPAPTTSDVTTWHYDNCRTGWQQHEGALNTTNVQNGFGLVAQWNGTSQHPMGRVFAEPLAVTIPEQVQVGGGPVCSNPCQLVLIADESDILWAYQADSNSQTPIWSIDLATAVGGIAPVDCTIITVGFGPCEQKVLGNSVGATGTGAVDESNPQDPTLYQAAVVDVAGIPAYYFYAVDVVQATLEATPIDDSITVPGQNPSDPEQDNICTSDYPANGPLQFNYNHIQRSALLLTPGTPPTIYVPFSPGDSEWENGWLIGYTYNAQAKTFARTAAFATTPYGTGGGIWGSGAGPASPDGTHIYTATANGTWDLWGGNPSSSDAADSVLNLIPDGMAECRSWTITHPPTRSRTCRPAGAQGAAALHPMTKT